MTMTAAEQAARLALELDQDYSDWKSAFAFCGGEDPHGNGGADIRLAPPGAAVSDDPFDRTDVIELIGMAEGENDGPAWLCAGWLRDGRWFMLRAFCDYTGWDCSANGNADVASTRGALLRYGMTEDEAERMGLAEERATHVPSEATIPAHGGYPGEVQVR